MSHRNRFKRQHGVAIPAAPETEAETTRLTDIPDADTLRALDDAKSGNKSPVSFTLLPYPGGPQVEIAHRKQLDDLIEKTKAAQQRNAERLVRERAYFIWEDAGYPNGRDVEHWLQAEREFKENLYKLLYGKAEKVLTEKVLTEKVLTQA